MSKQVLDDLLRFKLFDKVSAISDISEALVGKVNDLEKITYEVFEPVEHPEWRPDEFLVIHWKGGAISPRNCTGDSMAAIVEELGKMICGGYYGEVSFFNQYKSDPNFNWVTKELYEAKPQEVK